MATDYAAKARQASRDDAAALAAALGIAQSLVSVDAHGVARVNAQVLLQALARRAPDPEVRS